jgi:hypothetical protein
MQAIWDNILVFKQDIQAFLLEEAFAAQFMQVGVELHCIQSFAYIVTAHRMDHSFCCVMP